MAFQHRRAQRYAVALVAGGGLLGGILGYVYDKVRTWRTCA